MTRLLGIDAATQPDRTGLACADWDGATLRVGATHRPNGPEDQLAWLADRLTKDEPCLIGVDAPLGWPVGLAAALGTHRAGDPVAASADRLFRRRTDQAIQERLGKRPMDVGADRIARTAHAALALLGALAERSGSAIEPAWSEHEWSSPAVAEVYPAATLTALGLRASGYKGADTAARAALIQTLPDWVLLPEPAREAAISSDHVADAVITLVAAADFLAGRCPGPDEPERAYQEGWIWVREPTS
jgi:predicted RNase H-like nuclease